MPRTRRKGAHDHADERAILKRATMASNGGHGDNVTVEPRRDTRRPRAMRMLRATTVALVLPVLLGTACSAGKTASAHGTSGTSAVPDVRGELAQPAITDLRMAGFETFSVTGRWSTDAVGTVLSQEPVAGAPGGDGTSARLVLSLGPQRRVKPSGVFVGLGTCDLGPVVRSAACAGGPVILRP